MKTSVEKLFQMNTSDKGFLLLGQGESVQGRGGKYSKSFKANEHIVWVIPYSASEPSKSYQEQVAELKGNRQKGKQSNISINN